MNVTCTSYSCEITTVKHQGLRSSRYQLFAAVINQSGLQSLTLSSRSLSDHTQGIDGQQRRAEVSFESPRLLGQK